MIDLRLGDSLDLARELETGSVQTIVTSPPYWGLRDYGVTGQIGLERTPEEYVCKLVELFRELRRALKEDGTLWLNLGDSYANPNGNSGGCSPKSTLTGGGGKYRAGSKNEAMFNASNLLRRDLVGLKPKDLVGIPWRVAFALQADGWYLRSDIIWHKPNPMPESVTDRPTKSHEYIFLLTKSAKYYYDSEAVREPQQQTSIERARYKIGFNPKANGRPEKVSYVNQKTIDETRRKTVEGMGRNRRSVWTVTTRPFKGAHFATFPEALIEPCILAGSRVGDVVLDPFNGAGTTGVVALKHGRSYIGLELNPDYLELARERIAKVQYALT